jgi:hypothetical protein
MQKTIRKMELEVSHFLRLYWIKELEKIEAFSGINSLTEADQKEFKEFVLKIDKAMNIFGGNYETSIRH